MSILESYYRLPPELASHELRIGDAAPPHRVVDDIKTLYGTSPSGTAVDGELAKWLGERMRPAAGPSGPGISLSALVDELRFERYETNPSTGAGFSALTNAAYYFVRPILPVAVR